MESLDEDAKLMLRTETVTDAFSALYARHKARSIAICCGRCAMPRRRGLFQEVWSRLVATRSRYEARAKFATYLFHIAHNCAIDFFRRDPRCVWARADDAMRKPRSRSAGVSAPGPNRGILGAAVRVAHGFGRIAREQRELSVARGNGLTIEEIARVTDVGSRPPRVACVTRFVN